MAGLVPVARLLSKTSHSAANVAREIDTSNRALERRVYSALRLCPRRFMDEFRGMSDTEVKRDRYAKFRRVGVFNDF